MSRTGLGQFGVMPLTVVREPTRDSEDIHICPECSHPVVKSKGSQRIKKPDLVHVALAAAFDELVTFGWRCERHPYETRERWAKTFRSLVQLILEDLAQSFGHPPPNLPELMFRDARQPEKPRLLLSERVAEAFMRRSSA